MPNIIKRSKAKTTTQRFGELEIGGVLTIECNSYQAPHAFAKQAGIKIKTERTKKQPATGYRVRCERTA